MIKRNAILVLVSNNLVSDQRVNKIMLSLSNYYEYSKLVGRNYPKKPLEPKPYYTQRINLLFNKGWLFYFTYQIQLFIFLLFQPKADIWANDLDTLLPAFLVSKIKKVRLFYDSHEYFSEVPELITRGFRQSVWQYLENKLYPRLNCLITVNEYLAKLMQERFNVPSYFIKNTPLHTVNVNKSKRKERMVIYQGSINKGRGLEDFIDCVPYLRETKVLFVGKGDIINQLKYRSEILKVNDRVKFLGEIPFEKLSEITQTATIGISIEKSEGLNYELGLPNKLFDYIHHQVPVLVSSLKALKLLVNTHEIGQVLHSYEPKKMAKQINEMLDDHQKLKEYRNNEKKIRHHFLWKPEFKTVFEQINHNHYRGEG